MDSQATQPNTQQIVDPRRLGLDNSGLNEQDAADVLVILHPASEPAIRIAEDMAEHRPQHVLTRSPYDPYETMTSISEQETIILGNDNDNERLRPDMRSGASIALRLSSQLINPAVGFVFGRNPNMADVVVTRDMAKRISNQHFRIYLNSAAILMLEDMSTNGTIVDDVLLRNREVQRFSRTRTLIHGSIICMHNSSANDSIKFIVRIPSRSQQLNRFQENMHKFMLRCNPAGADPKAMQRLAARQGAGATMKWDGGDKYNIIGNVGKGAFATVYQVSTKMEGKVFAAKELEKRRFMKNGQFDRKMDNEMNIMQSLQHENIVQFVEYIDQGDYLYIIMEYVPYGDLQGHLHTYRYLTEAQGRTVAQQVMSALDYLHSKQITHRDIKPDNILIAELDPLTVKLSDFGLSKVIKHDETFLKTFCGTLLYCAPEVFPFDREAKGVKRQRGAAKQYHPYSSSVDTWSFAAVLWFSLCGKPPFEGIADTTGRAMYDNIMTTPLDCHPLRAASISDACIDFLSRMLQIDPSLRPTDRECRNHPWLRGDNPIIPEDPVLDSILEEDEDAEQRLSQLSLHEDFNSDEASEVLEDEEFDLLVNARAAKKVRKDPLFPRHQMRDKEGISSPEVSFASNGHVVEESFHLGSRAPSRARLFGEIGQSAFQEAQLTAAEGENNIVVPGTTAPLGVSSSIHARRSILQPDQYPPQLDGALSSPSLLGAESMVRDLHMESPQSPVSGAQTPNQPHTPPKTSESSTRNSLSHLSHSSNQHISQASEPTPKAKVAPAFDRTIKLDKTPSFWYDPYDRRTHTVEYANKVSGINYVSSSEAGDSKAESQGSGIPDTVRFSSQSSASSGASREPQLGATEIAAPLAQNDIKPPPRRLGKLNATPDSFAPSLVLTIDQRSTAWGRQSTNTIVYEDVRDTRIPKVAFILFWYTSDPRNRTVQSMSQSNEDWTKVNDLHVGIFTCATSGISVNGKHLRQKDDKGRALFGHLHTGDIIQVYHDPKGKECLKFKCEFYHGSGKEPRPVGQTFQIFPAHQLVV